MAPSRKVLAALTAWAAVEAAASAASAAECTGQGSEGQCGQTEEEVALLSHRRELHRQQRLFTEAKAGSKLKTYAGRAGVYEKFEVDTTKNIGIISGGKAPKQVLDPPSDGEKKMIEIINKNFAEVTGPGSFLPSNVKMDETWLACTMIDWSSYSKSDLKRGTTIFRQMEKELGIMENCWEGAEYENDPTCKAIFAALDSIVELQAEFPEGPKFAKALVSDWGYHGSAFPGSLGPVDMSSMPPHAEVLDPNGMNGFMLCEIVRTILTQSANQVGSGSCSFVASLAALESRAPAYAIKSAVRLLWTGRQTIYEPQSCDPVFDMEPGLVPYFSYSFGGSWQPRDTPANIRSAGAACTGNKHDCIAAVGSPAQPMGLVFAWYQALIGGYELDNYGNCEKFPRNTKLIWPGVSEATRDEVMLGGNVASDLWGCKRVLDPEGGSCQSLLNMDMCDASISDELCAEQMVTPMSMVIAKEAESMLKAQMRSNPELIPQKAKELGPGGEAMWSRMKEFSNSTDPQKIVLDFPMAWANSATSWPSFNEDLLNLACSAASATLVVYSDPMSDSEGNRHLPKSQPWVLMPDQQQAAFDEVVAEANPAYKEWVTREHPQLDYQNAVAAEINARTAKSVTEPKTCGHVVFLESCYPDEGLYTIWTWGSRFNISKTGLLGNAYFKTKFGRKPDETFTNGLVCSATIAQKVTMTQE